VFVDGEMFRALLLLAAIAIYMGAALSFAVLKLPDA
jgi:hypothetical protein